MDAKLIDFRNRMGDIQAAVKRRERVTVTSHGRPWAVVIAWEDYKPETPKASEFAAAGMWADRDDLVNPTEYITRLRVRRTFA
ncbi:MAG: type II toxin-antitoxin system prevent-host-death family antitoxin [Kiritimatiellae bacterium]|nr:type II toxin-antitoxin system prevent-host-death family antitoxin [Kiritimatiellia bacterium]MDD3545828.1 type II toxin-antitoxin system prevent-host-death family antitoxin [Kiritimatiellia bacterium]MDD4025040.1 type II toxin-antitoxin system prevent-host-death family antitoxin [Kiritimatiellia bacterium]